MSEPVARTIKDFCRAYGVSRTTAYRLIAAGNIAACKIGSHTLILEESAKAWLLNAPRLPGAYPEGNNGGGS